MRSTSLPYDAPGISIFEEVELVRVSLLGPKILGVAGGSGSGKSTFIRQLREHLGSRSLAVLAVDDYYHDLSELAPSLREEFNFDCEDAIEFPLLLEHVDALQRGETVACPIYDFATHTRVQSTKCVHSAEIILVDGIMSLAHPELRKRFDLSVFIRLDDETRLQRRVLRDQLERGRSEESVIQQWNATVDPFHRRVIEPSAQYADLVVQTQDFASLCGTLKHLLAD